MFFEKSNSQPNLGQHPKDVPMVNFSQDGMSQSMGGNVDPFRQSNQSNRSKKNEGSFRDKNHEFNSSALKGESSFMPISQSERSNFAERM